MSPGEGSGGPADGGSEGGAGTSAGGGDIGAILAYLRHWRFGNDGDYTGNAGYGGDNIGPPGSKKPEQGSSPSTSFPEILMPPHHVSVRQPRTGRSRISAPPAKSEAPPTSLYPFTGMDVDAFSGLPIEADHLDAFTGGPTPEILTAAKRPVPVNAAGHATAIRQRGLLSSPYLLADNLVVCDPNRTSCRPPRTASDFNQSSMVNSIQAEMDESDVAIQAFLEGKAKIIINTETDMQTIATQALQITMSDEYKLAATVNQLRSHPLEIRRSAALTGLGHVAEGLATMALSGVVIYGSGGVALPLGGAMGFASGLARTSSGLALAASGADSTDTLRMGSQLDYAFTLTSSPTSLMFGTTGLVLSQGDVETSHRFAVIGGLAEDVARFRGDPSKLYASVLPGMATKAERTSSALLLKDVTALGYRARAEGIEQVAAKLNRNFTVEDLQAIAAFRKEMGISGRLDLAGVAGHAAAGGAGSGRGVDFIKHGGAFQQELKLHGPNTWIASWYMNKAWTQSLNYSIKYQLETRALGEHLVPLRSVKHIWISPTEAVRYVK